MDSKELQQNRLQILGKLTASLIHEIRNPLSVIKLNIDYLNMIKEQVSPEVQEIFYSCNEAAKRMLFLIENFSDFSKKPHQEAEICSIKEVTQMAVNVMHLNAVRLNITINTEIADHLPSICFQKDKLLQVFLNLISNAIDAEGHSNVINIRVNCDQKTICKKIIWEIEDFGTGMSEEDKKNVFHDFYTSKKKGTGLGLSVCNMLLKEYNADITFKSKLNKGTKFTLTFNPNS